MKVFTPKEIEIIELILEAHPLKVIAQKKKNSINTIHTHIRNIHIKTKTRSIPQLILWLRVNYNKP